MRGACAFSMLRVPRVERNVLKTASVERNARSGAECFAAMARARVAQTSTNVNHFAATFPPATIVMVAAVRVDARRRMLGRHMQVEDRLQ